MIRRIFITGLAAIIPLVITVAVIVWLFNFADGILGATINSYLQSLLGYQVPGLGLILFLLIIFLAGLLLVVSKMSILRFFERLFFKIPLINSIYFPLRKIVDLLFMDKPSQSKGVVLVEYPRKGIYSIGFVTNKKPQQIVKALGKKMYTVFIPNSPIPSTGFTIVVPEEDIISLDISIEEAIKIVVSGGMLSAHDAPK